MERYSSYRPTSIQWLKEIPSHWEEKRLKYIVSIKSGDAIRNQQLSDEGEYPVYGGGQCIGYSDRYNTTAEDLLIGRVGAKCGCVTFPGIKSWATDNALILSTNFNRRLLLYILIACDLNRLNTSNAQPLITSTKVKNTGIPIPPLAEQEKIVSYLEGRTSKIDAYVAEKEKEIQLLQELKQKTIADAVTKGLNPDVKMKDSGISWLGLIPEHWETKKIGSLFIERREKVSDKDYPALSVSKQGITPQLETAVKTDNGDNRKKVCKNDFVVNSRSDRKGSCGVSPYTGSVSLINIVLAPRNTIEEQYYHHLFRSNDYIEEYYRIGRGIVADLWTTRYSEMRNSFVPFPSIAEQRAIVTYIEEKCQKIDTLVSELKVEIDNMKEYKQRLISDCVTGQVKV